MQINPYGNEIRYTSGLMVYHLRTARPGSVRIASRSVEIVQSIVRQLCCEPVQILVENPQIKSSIANTFGFQVNIVEPGNKPADAALFPFSLDEDIQPAGERMIVAACNNALSYKSLLYPQSVKGTVFQKLARLKSNYQLSPVAGLFSPHFILWMTLAKLAERRNSAWYFQLEDRAMRHLIETGPLWRLSYIVIITGQSAR